MADKWSDGVKAGSVDVSVEAVIRSTSTNLEVTGKVAADVTASYWRQGGVRVAISVSNLGSVNAAHSDGGWIEVDATNIPGLYRFDLPDAAVATGADWVMMALKISNAYVFFQKFPLTTGVIQTADHTAALTSIQADTNDIQTRLPAALGVGGNMKADVLGWNGTTLGAVQQAGWPTVTVKDGTGTGEIDTNGGAVQSVNSIVNPVTSNVTQWSGTSVAAPDTAGFPKVTIKDGAGQGEINLTSGKIDTVTNLENPSPANVTQWNGVNVAAPDSAGHPKVTVKTGTSTGELSLSGGVVDADVQQWRGINVPVPHTDGYPIITLKQGVGNGELNTLNGSAEARVVGLETGGTTQTATAVTNALNTAVPGSPTADSVFERLKTLDDFYTSARAALLDNLNATITSRASPADVDAEMRDVLATETLSDPTTGAPSNAPSVKTALAVLYFYLRNKVTNDGTILKVHDDSGTCVWKRTVSEVTGLFTREEAVSGP